MKRFIKNISIYFLIVLLSSMGITKIYESKIWCYSLDAQKDKQFQFEEEKYKKILFWGDSHTLASIFPANVENSYNMGYTSQHYAAMYYRIRNYIANEQMDNTQLLFIQFDYHNLNTSIEGIARYWEKIVGFTISDLVSFRFDQEVTYLVLKHYFNNLFWRYSNWRKDIGNIGSAGVWRFDGNQYGYPMNRYFDSFDDLSIQDKIFNAEERAQTHFSRDKEINPDLLFEHLVKIIDLVKSSDMQIVLISYPLSKYYYKSINYEEAIQKQHHKYLEKLLSTYNLHHLNYTEEFLNSDSLFYDADHLNLRGAKKLSKIINSDIKRLASEGKIESP